MDAEQRQVIDSFVPVRSFLDAQPATGPLEKTPATTAAPPRR